MTTLDLGAIHAGQLKFWKVGQGYGFVRIDGDDANAPGAFMHITDVDGHEAHRELAVGQRLRFTLEENEKGLRARNITLIGPE